MRPRKESGSKRVLARVVASAAFLVAAVLIGAALFGSGAVMHLADIYWGMPGR